MRSLMTLMSRSLNGDISTEVTIDNLHRLNRKWMIRFRWLPSRNSPIITFFANSISAIQNLRNIQEDIVKSSAETAGSHNGNK
ncbi:hypothetical protein CDAR_76261 [Caerostris darwini]|uniref:Uncharacterized protein n=1 Tax=Caerostris darwini TaxID=1538125 RepID=A0AAV4PYF5_9ARAC|nr:hypothetical protein CDAR_76261 [Caerostris darwini]